MDQQQLFPYTPTPAPEPLSEFEENSYTRGTPTIRFPGEKLRGVLDHGGIRNVHQTAPGSPRSEGRAKLETQLGLSNPVYGYMDVPDRSLAQPYGDVMARLTPQAAARSTTSRGDTVNRGADSPEHVAPMGEIPRMIRDRPADVGSDPYVEVQTPTTDGTLPLSDIERMDFNAQNTGRRRALEGRDEARAAGVNARAVDVDAFYEPSFGNLNNHQFMDDYGLGRTHYRGLEEIDW